MRILHMVHDFFPNHVAGVEVFTDHLTRRLAQDHDVALLYSEIVHDVPNYGLRRGCHGKVQIYELVNNHHLRSFRETYQNPAIDRRIVEVLEEFRPDVVHFQHLMNLSVGAVGELRRREIPMVMTLHDHWLACANGGQRFHQELMRCDELDARRCGSCTAHMNGVGLFAGGLKQRYLRRLAEPGQTLSILDLEPESIEVPESNFVYRDTYELGGQSLATLVAHPPAQLDFLVHLEGEGTFHTAAAMHPDTFEAEGGGVRFRVVVDGAARGEITLDPKRKHEDRSPRSLQVALEAGDHLLQLNTESVPAHRGECCTAGWIAPRIEVRSGRARPTLTTPIRVVSKLGRLGAQVAGRLQARRITERWEVMRHLGTEIDLFIAPSSYLGDAMVEFGLPRARVIHSDYGFVSEEFERRRDLPRVARRFTFIGSLVRHKGVHVLLEAFRSLPEDARLDLWGSPDYDPIYYQSLIQRVQHPGVHFRGALEPARVPAFLRTVDVQIVPSIWNENSPLTIHEAFLTGIPVVASRLGGNVELLASGGGLLYEPDDVDELAALLRRLYDEPGLVQRLGASVPPVKSMEFHCQELLEIYSELVSASQ